MHQNNDIRGLTGSCQIMGTQGIRLITTATLKDTNCYIIFFLYVDDIANCRIRHGEDQRLEVAALR